MGRSITPAAGAARRFAEGLLNQIKQMPEAEQMQVMRDLANHADTSISRSYGYFSVNTKLAFWYELAELMKQGTVAPVPTGYEMSRGVAAVLEAIKKIDPVSKLLRNTVLDMGFEPAGAASNEQRAAEPMFKRTEPAPTQITVEGITEPTVLGYLKP